MNVNRSVQWGAMVCILFLVAAACGSDDSKDSSAGSGSGSTRLWGRSWTLSDATSLGAPLADVSVTAEFDASQITGSSGCNTYGAPYRVDGDTMTIGPDIAATRKACEAAATAVEQAYLARLPQVASYEITGTTLTLRSETDATLLVYAAADGAATIVGGWKATSYYTGDAIEGVAAGSTPTAAFDGRQVSGTGGCNRFSGPYVVSGQSKIKIGPLASTMMACSDPALTTQEQQYLAALQLAASFRVTRTRLDLLRDGGTIAATFDAVPPGG
jgi:heat shock protein HslJ